MKAPESFKGITLKVTVSTNLASQFLEYKNVIKKMILLEFSKL